MHTDTASFLRKSKTFFLDKGEGNTFFKRLYLFIYLFLERGREGEKEGENHQCVVASQPPPTGDLAHNPGLCPDWESNWRPFGLQSDNPLSHTNQGNILHLKKKITNNLG